MPVATIQLIKTFSFKGKIFNEQKVSVPNKIMSERHGNLKQNRRRCKMTLLGGIHQEDINIGNEDTKSSIIQDKDFGNTNKNIGENEKELSPHLFHEEDLQNLLLHYMKLTFLLRKKSERDETFQTEGDLKNKDYSVSTDYDSDEDPALKNYTPKSLILKCKQCFKLLRGTHSLKNHCMRKHGNHSEKKVLCDKCPTLFYTDFELNRHYQTHNSIKNYLCHLCSKKFFQKSSLELHLRYHKNDRRYQCEICRKKFFTNNHLKRHCITHTNKRDFKCEPCERSFRYKDHLRRHLQSVHIGVRSHHCRECDKSFMYRSQLKFHEQSHTNVQLKCKHCNQTFKKGSFKVHQGQCKGKGIISPA